MNSIEEREKKEKEYAERQLLENVIDSIDRVPLDVKQAIFSMSNEMGEMEIIQSFNQQAQDMFASVLYMTKKVNKDKEYNFSGYKVLFDTAIKHNNKLPIDKFTLIILEFAAEIYAGEEDCFLKMSIPDKEVKVGNEFGMIRSESFKILWKLLGRSDKKKLKDQIQSLTTFSHAYLYKTITKMASQNM